MPRRGNCVRGQDHQTFQRIIERTPPVVRINFLMTDITWENGPMRQIPGTQGRPYHPPSPPNEPDWMRGAYVRGEGRGQERSLAQTYCNWSRALAFQHPYVSNVLEGIAERYDRHAEMEDSEAGSIK
jgi:ectoine hydroxylase-related dioxygenase (phytanoyl-CoA dioxygenase family)